MSPKYTTFNRNNIQKAMGSVQEALDLLDLDGDKYEMLHWSEREDLVVQCLEDAQHHLMAVEGGQASES